MSVHAVVTLKIETPEKLAAYRDRAADALSKHGGEVVQASRELSLLEGETELPDLIAILKFPDREAARAWKSDPDLQEVHALRQGSGRCRIILL